MCCVVPEASVRIQGVILRCEVTIAFREEACVTGLAGSFNSSVEIGSRKA